MTYRLFLPYGCVRHHSKIYASKNNLPYVEDSTDNRWVYCLNKTYIDWLEENNISYSLEIYGLMPNSYLIFDNKSDAILFKLTWIGTE